MTIKHVCTQQGCEYTDGYHCFDSTCEFNKTSQSSYYNIRVIHEEEVIRMIAHYKQSHPNIVLDTDGALYRLDLFTKEVTAHEESLKRARDNLSKARQMYNDLIHKIEKPILFHLCYKRGCGQEHADAKYRKNIPDHTVDTKTIRFVVCNYHLSTAYDHVDALCGGDGCLQVCSTKNSTCVFHGGPHQDTPFSIVVVESK